MNCNDLMNCPMCIKTRCTAIAAAFYFNFIATALSTAVGDNFCEPSLFLTMGYLQVRLSIGSGITMVEKTITDGKGKINRTQSTR